MFCRKLFLLVLFSASFQYTESTPNNSSGFLSIDCGSGQDYVDPDTGIPYKSDRNFISTGENQEISPEFDTEIPYFGRQLKNLRYFPKGRKNCYSLKPEQGKNHKYLIRVYFKYGNFDSTNEIPVFFVYLGVNVFPSVHLKNQTDWMFMETIHYSTTDTIDVCLVSSGSGTPFISALEIRFVEDFSYMNMSEPLYSLFRIDLGKPLNQYVRHSDDVYDRMWATGNVPGSVTLNTTVDIAIDNSSKTNPQQFPNQVWTSASQPRYPLRAFVVAMEPPCPEKRCYFCLYFSEILNTYDSNKTREFFVVVNGVINGTIRLRYMEPVSLCQPYEGPLAISLNSTNRSQLPPILNALEFFVVVPFPNLPTDPTDVEGISSIIEAYNIDRDEWQGDPCVPADLSWDGINCTYDIVPSRIVSLDLSSSNLRGNISSAFFNLKGLNYLDLSNNELTGMVPEFFAELPNLTSLNLSGNKLTGLVPQSLLEKSKNGVLQLSLQGNPNLCESADSCAKTSKRRTNYVVPLTTSVIGGLVLLLLISLIVLWRKQIQDAKSRNDGAGLSKSHSFSFAEIARITDDFKTIIGEGGFGKVYLGTLSDQNSQLVAVKLLSQLSRQGYKEFQAEAQLLMTVHHRNLVSLIGYCDDHHNKALIYEYMANGNLREHLAETTSGMILSWEERLEIAVDAAQGLEYLHNGCKPPIVHRDLKTSNILLNERFQAAISDFGLSRAFPSESESHINTTPAGTYGYMAPEIQTSGNFNKKSDVYAFGIIILELITGHPAIRRDASGDIVLIQHWVRSMLERGDIRSVVDQKLQGGFEPNSAWKATETALACSSDTPTGRPDMSSVLVELKECLALAKPVEPRTGSLSPIERPVEINSNMVPSPR